MCGWCVVTHRCELGLVWGVVVCVLLAFGWLSVYFVVLVLARFGLGVCWCLFGFGVYYEFVRFVPL